MKLFLSNVSFPLCFFFVLFYANCLQVGTSAVVASQWLKLECFPFLQQQRSFTLSKFYFLEPHYIIFSKPAESLFFSNH